MPTYKEINSAWPDPMPVPTPAEAIKGTKRLIRKAFALARDDGVERSYSNYMTGRKFKITSGNRHTWPQSGAWLVNPNEQRGRGGWSEIVHSVSHWAQRRFWPKENPHGPRHVTLERDLAAYAIANFLDGQLARPERATPPVKHVRAARVATRIKRWESVERRAVKALRKLRRQARYYERAMETK